MRAAWLLACVLYTSCACAALMGMPAAAGARGAPPRARRELRTLDGAERDALFAALWALKNTSAAVGTTRYGADFRPYDYFTLKHAVAVSDTRGDQAHFGPSFMTFHRLFVLECAPPPLLKCYCVWIHSYWWIFDLLNGSQVPIAAKAGHLGLLSKICSLRSPPPWPRRFEPFDRERMLTRVTGALQSGAA